MMMEYCDYGWLFDGWMVYEYCLDNGLGLQLIVIMLGGIVIGLWVFDVQGLSGNVVLGFDNFDDYVYCNLFFGIIVGCYGN